MPGVTGSSPVSSTILNAEIAGGISASGCRICWGSHWGPLCPIAGVFGHNKSHNAEARREAVLTLSRRGRVPQPRSAPVRAELGSGAAIPSDQRSGVEEAGAGQREQTHRPPGAPSSTGNPAKPSTGRSVDRHAAQPSPTSSWSPPGALRACAALSRRPHLDHMPCYKQAISSGFGKEVAFPCGEVLHHC
jgi:hypothetical protein